MECDTQSDSDEEENSEPLSYRLKLHAADPRYITNSEDCNRAIEPWYRPESRSKPSTSSSSHPASTGWKPSNSPFTRSYARWAWPTIPPRQVSSVSPAKLVGRTCSTLKSSTTRCRPNQATPLSKPLQTTKTSLGAWHQVATHLKALEEACESIEEKTGCSSRWSIMEIMSWKMKSNPGDLVDDKRSPPSNTTCAYTSSAATRLEPKEKKVQRRQP